MVFAIIALASTNVAVAAAWISRGTGHTIPASVRDAAVSFAGAMTLGVVVLSGFGLLGR